MFKASKNAIFQIRNFSAYKLTGKNFIGNERVSGKTKCKRKALKLNFKICDIIIL